MGIQPRSESQLRHNIMCRGPNFDGPSYRLSQSSGSSHVVEAAEVEKAGLYVIVNPFFTSLWPQDPKNMTSSPFITTPASQKMASWRRMQLTSPPILRVGLQVW